jgi:hypothetical protein
MDEKEAGCVLLMVIGVAEFIIGLAGGYGPVSWFGGHQAFCFWWSGLGIGIALGALSHLIRSNIP